MINEKRAVNTFMQLVQIDSVSLNERAVADFLMQHFSDMGYAVEEDIKAKSAVAGASVGNVIVKIPGKGAKANDETIILCSHMDTVEPGNGVKPQLSEDGKYVVSDGTTILGADDKAGIAQILEVVQVLGETGIDHRPIELVFTICEEIGLHGAKNLDVSKLKGKMAYVLDAGPAPGYAIIGGPDYYDVSGRIIGKAAHAGGAPDKGISSIQVMAEAISHMKLLKIDEDTTTNIGRVICDYPTNVVPEVTTFELEVRSLDNQKGLLQLEHVLTTLQAAADKYGAKLELTHNQSLQAYRLSEQDKVLTHFKSVCEKHDLPVETVVIRGGTDVSGFVDNGIAAMAIAGGGQYAHELRERLEIANFIACVRQTLWLVTE